MSTANEIGTLAVKLADAALVARKQGDVVHALFFAQKAAECLALAKALGWEADLEMSTPGSLLPGGIVLIDET